jgi:hypothetical protein
MHLYSTPWYITSEPMEYAVFGAQLGMVCAIAASGSARQRMTPRAKTSRDFIFIDDLLERLVTSIAVVLERRRKDGRALQPSGACRQLEGLLKVRLAEKFARCSSSTAELPPDRAPD